MKKFWPRLVNSHLCRWLYKFNQSLSDESPAPCWLRKLIEYVPFLSTVVFLWYGLFSVSMTWALLELAQNPDIQKKLRNEILAFGSEPTLDQMASSLPFLDAVVHEALRLHPPVPDILRVVCPIHAMVLLHAFHLHRFSRHVKTMLFLFQNLCVHVQGK